AIVAVVLRLGLREVSIVPGKGDNQKGYCICKTLATPKYAGPLEVEKDAVLYAAGIVAGQFVRPRGWMTREVGGGCTRVAAGTHVLIHGTDIYKIHLLHEAAELPEEDFGRWFVMIHRRALDILAKHKDAFITVTDALLAKRRLTGKEVREIVRSKK